MDQLQKLHLQILQLRLLLNLDQQRSLSASSSFLLSSTARWTRKARAEASTASSAAAAREGMASCERPTSDEARTAARATPAAPEARRAAPAASPGLEASVAVARRTAHPPPPPLPWAARCGASLQPGPFGATAARDASPSAAVAPSGGEHFLCRRPLRSRHPSSSTARASAAGDARKRSTRTKQAPGVGGSDDSKHAVPVQGHADNAPDWVAEPPGASSPPPLPRPDGGGQPLAHH